MEDSQKDLNTVTVTDDDGQSETTENTTESKDTEVAELQERLKKTEEERDNYKTGLLKLKKTDRTLEAKKDTTVRSLDQQDEDADWDDDSKKFQKQTLSKAEKVAQKAAESVYQKANEKQAINSFLEQYPDFQSDEEWQEILSNYNPKNGKDSVSNIMKDLERARINVLYEKGDLEKLSVEAENRGKQRGYAEGMHADLMTSGGTRQKSSNKDGKEISDGARALATKFRIDPKKLAQEDDSNRATISF
ncbi:MAG: hypothetical protein WC803_12695 [Sphingomonas sp.]|jgi:hypothetical protein